MSGLSAAFATLVPTEVSCDDVDISTNDLQVPTPEQAVDADVKQALHAWNAISSADEEADRVYMDRLDFYRGIAQETLYADHPNVHSAAVARRSKRSKVERRHDKQQQIKIAQVFQHLRPICDVRKATRPTERVAKVVQDHPPDLRTQSMKRSVASTSTFRSFSFARKHPMFNDNASSFQRDLLLHFEVLHPSKEPSKSQHFIVRNSQHLHELFDRIACANEERLQHVKKESSLFFWDGHFYTDKRPPARLDYAPAVQEWIKAKPHRRVFGGEDEAKRMERTSFQDLGLQADMPGVFIHLGECEHVVRLHNVRLPHEHDSGRKQDFPLLLPMEPSKLRLCYICNHFTAKYVTYNDPLATAEPMLYCPRCYQTSHYDAKGDPVYHDDTYKYVQE